MTKVKRITKKMTPKDLINEIKLALLIMRTRYVIDMDTGKPKRFPTEHKILILQTILMDMFRLKRDYIIVPKNTKIRADENFIIMVDEQTGIQISIGSGSNGHD